MGGGVDIRRSPNFSALAPSPQRSQTFALFLLISVHGAMAFWGGLPGKPEFRRICSVHQAMTLWGGAHSIKLNCYTSGQLNIANPCGGVKTMTKTTN